MKFLPSQVPDVVLIEPDVHGDDRGFFMETYHASRYSINGIADSFVQDNHSGSGKAVLRGLHYQIQQAQGKLVRVVAGEIFDVAVDLRRSSATFGFWNGQILSVQNKYQLWIPGGFAHGFYVLSDWAEIVYKATDYYAPQWERTLLWNDPAIGIAWPLLDDLAPILSEKDSRGLPLAQAETYA